MQLIKLAEGICSDLLGFSDHLKHELQQIMVVELQHCKAPACFDKVFATESWMACWLALWPSAHDVITNGLTKGFILHSTAWQCSSTSHDLCWAELTNSRCDGLSCWGEKVNVYQAHFGQNRQKRSQLFRSEGLMPCLPGIPTHCDNVCSGPRVLLTGLRF